MVGDNLAGTSSHDDMVRSALANKLCDDEYVIFLAVKDMKEAVGISEKLSSSRLESSDYEKIRIATTEEKSKWDSVLGMIKLDSRQPKTPEKILPYSYSELLRMGCCDTSFCPKFYDLITRYSGNIVIAKCTKELQEELMDNGVRFL